MQEAFSSHESSDSDKLTPNKINENNSYEGLNNDVWNDIFPVGTQSTEMSVDQLLLPKEESFNTQSFSNSHQVPCPNNVIFENITVIIDSEQDILLNPLSINPCTSSFGEVYETINDNDSIQTGNGILPAVHGVLLDCNENRSLPSIHMARNQVSCVSIKYLVSGRTCILIVVSALLVSILGGVMEAFIRSTDKSIMIQEKNQTVQESKNLLNASSFLKINNPRLVGVIPKDNFILGMTVLGSQLFVTKLISSHVSVFDTNNFTLTRRNKTTTGSSIVASPWYNCLYITNFKNNVYRYNLFNNVISNWSVSESDSKLSLTSTYNVLVTLSKKKQIKEFTPDGILVREISLESSIENPRHSVQLSSGQFVVSHAGTLHRVCIVDASGRIIQCYGESEGSDVGELYYPTNLAADGYSNLLVADKGNNRVVLLSPTLTHLGYIRIPGQRLRMPDALHLDLLTRRLYIGEDTNTGRVFVLAA